MHVVLLFALLGVALGAPTTQDPSTTPKKAPPTPCDTTLQWEGRSSEWDHVREYNNRFLISFDGKNQRKRLMEEKRSYMPGHRYIEYLQFYNDKLEYQIDHTYNVCTKLPLGPWRNHTIPDDAVLEDQYDVGQPGHAIYANEWSDRVTGRYKEEWIGVFTTAKDGCWPLFEVYSKDEANKSISYSTRFFNLSAGIKDPSVFDIPDICKKVQLTPLPDLPTLVNEVQPTQAPGFFAKIKTWLFQRKNDSSDKLLKKAGVVKTWGKQMDQI
ncbi:mammalian ependymin-related protein 1-like [Amphiura filiformis]|uniref:mammalian ependymin-related protein 1-like n=1 Tax=Amphiura filiformis TaxID=82378 RepID=UPI003B21C130